MSAFTQMVACLLERVQKDAVGMIRIQKADQNWKQVQSFCYLIGRVLIYFCFYISHHI